MNGNQNLNWLLQLFAAECRYSSSALKSSSKQSIDTRTVLIRKSLLRENFMLFITCENVFGAIGGRRSHCWPIRASHSEFLRNLVQDGSMWYFTLLVEPSRNNCLEMSSARHKSWFKIVFFALRHCNQTFQSREVVKCLVDWRAIFGHVQRLVSQEFLFNQRQPDNRVS